MSKRGTKKPKMDDVEEMDTGQSCSSSSLAKPAKSKEERRAELDKLYWDYYDDFGELFTPTSRKIELLHDYLSIRWKRAERNQVITELRPVSEACKGCGCRDPKIKFSGSNICYLCIDHVSRKECLCDGVPQLLNECVPIWSPQYNLHCDCQRCKKVALGKLDKSTNEKKPDCTLSGGYARFQDLAVVKNNTEYISSLFPQDAECAALIVRTMKFTETNKRVLANSLVKFRLDNPLLTALNGFQQIVHAELHSAKVTRNVNEGFRLVKIEDKIPLNFGLSVNNKWTSVPAKEINMYNLADVYANVQLNSQAGQGIQTELVISQIKLKPEHEYASLASLESHLATRGAKLIWEETHEEGTKLVFVQPDEKDPATKQVIVRNRKGLIYLHAIEADDYIFVSIGSTVGDKPRPHYASGGTALSKFKMGKSALKEFSCVLYYVVVDDEDDLLMYESILQNVFLLAQLKELSFKKFIPPFTDGLNQFNQKKWKDLDIKDAPDKPIKILNSEIIMRSYTQAQFDKIVNFFTVLLNVQFGIEYEWDNDPLKFVIPNQ